MSAREYIVGEGDILKITVYDHSDLTTVVRVSGDGAITFPLIGQINVSGVTVMRIEEMLAAKLADGFIVDPQLSVFVQEFRSRKTIIMGKVNSPGLYELHGQITFLELLSKAGGLSRDAGDRAVIKRRTVGNGAEGEVITLDLNRLIREGDTSLDVEIMDGDNVYIDEAGVFYITGEVKKPDVYKMEEDLTVMKAVSVAGGFTDKADRERILVVRETQGQEEILELGKGDDTLDVPVGPGDSIHVPKAGMFYVTGEVKKPGAYAYEKGATLIKAVTLAGGFTERAARGRVRIIRTVDGEEKTMKKVSLDYPVLPEDVVIIPESFF